MKNYLDLYVIWPFKDFINGVKNLFYFFKVIWQWRRWDYSYSLRLLKRSIEGHRDGIKEYSYSMYKEDNELAIAQELLEILHRMIEDDYTYYTGVQYDNMKIDFVPITRENYPKGLDFEEGMSEMKTTFLNGYTKKEHDKLIDQAQKMHEKDLKRFGELMSKIEYLWY